MMRFWGEEKKRYAKTKAFWQGKVTMLHFGILGEKLSHSYSPMIHRLLGDYAYDVFEKSPDEVGTFLRSGSFDGFNVTIPYKKTVYEQMDVVSDAAKEIGSVNTVVRMADGRLFGDNTDVYGFRRMVEKTGVSLSGKKVLVLGSGGASVAVQYVLRQLQARTVVISRKGPDNYGNLQKHADAFAIVNTTPLGMYPKNGENPVNLADFPACRLVLDLIYNPARTALLLQAEELGIPYENGLYMLVAQAKRASELFTETSIADSEIDRIYGIMCRDLQSIILIGMPGCGKSTVAKKLGDLMGRPVLDTDEEFTKRYNKSPEEVIRSDGEETFRRMETEVLRETASRSGVILSTGGGVVTREENYPLLHQNGVIIWLKRDTECLETAHRPLSQAVGTAELYREREPLYEAFSDYALQVTEHTAEEIVSFLRK